MAFTRSGLIDPSVFVEIQQKIDDDTKFREELREIVDDISKHVRSAQSILQVAHSTSKADVGNVIDELGYAMAPLREGMQKLAAEASLQPYYKWNNMWTKIVQDTIFVVLLEVWIRQETLLTPEEVGDLFDVPVGASTDDRFHLSTEEYLLALITLIEELSRLARNSVTVGDYERPLAISKFVKDIHAGFQTLNLKNDILRKRSDGIKYRLKDVEDVVYDLSLRNLIPKDSTAA